MGILGFNIVLNDDLNNYFDKYQSDSIFKRSIIYNNNKDFKSQYFFDIREKYYLYIKKYFGFSNAYKYNHELNLMFDFMYFKNNAQFYQNSIDYKLINNELLIVSGQQLYTLTINYNSLLDFYIQKVDDCDYIQINTELYPTGNLVKLLNGNKKYYLNFTVDHIIMLGNEFENAEVTFKNEIGESFTLNKEKRIIKDLTGDNISIISTEKAFIYFYKRIPDYSEEGTIVFDKSQKNKILKITIQNKRSNNLNIVLAKDFCLKGY
jgi:hypothetical protein